MVLPGLMKSPSCLSLAVGQCPVPDRRVVVIRVLVVVTKFSNLDPRASGRNQVRWVESRGVLGAEVFRFDVAVLFLLARLHVAFHRLRCLPSRIEAGWVQCRAIAKRFFRRKAVEGGPTGRGGGKLSCRCIPWQIILG